MKKSRNLYSLRKDYHRGALSESEVLPCPFEQFSEWFREAEHPDYQEFMEPNVMTLCTAGKDLQPKSRIVLLKKFDTDGFVFFSNYESEKARNIAENNKVSLAFFWEVLQRQIRIHGRVWKTSDAVSDRYFDARPYESRLAACASPQSRPITKEALLRRYENLKRDREPVSRPKNWGGYTVKPHYFEYWQGGRSRLHDRISYIEHPEGWKIKRLAP